METRGQVGGFNGRIDQVRTELIRHLIGSYDVEFEVNGSFLGWRLSVGLRLRRPLREEALDGPPS